MGEDVKHSLNAAARSWPLGALTWTVQIFGGGSWRAALARRRGAGRAVGAGAACRAGEAAIAGAAAGVGAGAACCAAGIEAPGGGIFDWVKIWFCAAVAPLAALHRPKPRHNAVAEKTALIAAVLLLLLI